MIKSVPFTVWILILISPGCLPCPHTHSSKTPPHTHTLNHWRNLIWYCRSPLLILAVSYKFKANVRRTGTTAEGRAAPAKQVWLLLLYWHAGWLIRVRRPLCLYAQLLNTWATEWSCSTVIHNVNDLYETCGRLSFYKIHTVSDASFNNPRN